jgi:hypothetical protein
MEAKCPSCKYRENRAVEKYRFPDDYKASRLNKAEQSQFDDRDLSRQWKQEECLKDVCRKHFDQGE